ncbi:MAG: metal ABC transporter permease, partial [bacterium]
FFISKTRGYQDDLMSYLFGNILMVKKSDLWMTFFLDVFIAAVTFLFYNKFMAVCFDEEFARLRGIKTSFYYIILLCMTAVTIVVLIQIVGIIMVIALLTLPAAIASHFTGQLWKIMLLSMGLSTAFCWSGLALSYKPDLPSGAAIIILSGAVYLLVLLFKFIKKAGK